jgi:glucokinase
MASEGGHCDFAARNPLEMELLTWLMQKFNGRVSFERVVSGPGLTNIYTFLRDEKHMEEPAWLRQRMEAEDPNVVIGEVGEEGKSELCAKALAMFAASYGAEAGNMVLKVLATGGMYLGGGIAPKMLKTMQSGVFMQAFADKGRLSELLIHTPVHIILESRAALMGAAAYAEARAAEISGKSVRAASR